MESSAGSKRVTLAQVAELAGVSVMTASYAYNRPERVSERARSKVLDAAARLGYAGPDPSARSLRRGSTRTLGVVMGEHLSYAFEDPEAASFLAGIADVCADRGYGMTILPITGAADDGRRVAEAAVDGFVVWTTSDDDPGWAQLSRVGQNINKQSPEFDSRNYGYAKLSGLIGAIGLFDAEERQVGNGKHIYVRSHGKK